MKKIIRYTRKFMRRYPETYKNKMYAIALVIVGLVSMGILKDMTFLVLTLLVGVPLFKSDTNHIMN